MSRIRVIAWRALVLAAAATPLWLDAATAAAPPKPPPEFCGVPLTLVPPAASTVRMAERLAALTRIANPATNPFATGRAIAGLRTQLAATGELPEILRLKPALAELLLNDGQTAAAIREFADYEALLATHHVSAPPEDDARFRLMKGIAFLRLGEEQNCLLHHHADSCLFPIRGGGVHLQPEGSRRAAAAFEDLLARDPSRLEAAWLLNIAYMTLGEYPGQVPRRWVLKPALFESGYALPRFPDVAGALGLDVDDCAGGVVMDDFDNDGRPDLMVSSSGLESPLRIFHNQGDGRFVEFTEAAGLIGLTGGLNLIQADYNNDGFVDVLVLRGGWLGEEDCFPNSLLRNNGNGTFTDVTEEAGVLSFHPTQTAVWFDYNGDGQVDLFIGNEAATSTSPHRCELYRNNGDGTFTECAVENGLGITAFVKAVASADYNHDGRPDLYISIRGAPNRLMRNDGAADGRWAFTDVAASAGVSEPLFSFPCWFWDYDEDGWPDLAVTGYGLRNAGDVALDYLGKPHPAERARLYRNNRDGTFTDVTRAAGLFHVIHAMGANFGDLDNDGWLDFYAGTGDPFLGTLIPSRMFRHDGQGRFQDVTTAGGFGQLQKGHGIAWGDLNGDGTQDIYSVVGGAYPGDHYRNQLFANPPNDRHWLKLKLEGVTANRSALGARITVIVATPAGERRIHRTVGSGGSFGASPLRQEIGLDDARQITRVEIVWPAPGATQVFTGLELDHTYLLREHAAAPLAVAFPAFAWPSGHAAAPHVHAAGR